MDKDDPKAPLLAKEDLVAAIAKHFHQEYSVEETPVIARFLRLKKEERFEQRGENDQFMNHPYTNKDRASTRPKKRYAPNGVISAGLSDQQKGIVPKKWA